MLEAKRASGPLFGRMSPPGDKSISHRALILGALAEGQSEIRGLLEGDDVLATKSALEQIGASFTNDGMHLLVNGIGTDGLQPPSAPLNMGNSGTAIRLLSGVLAAQAFDSELYGDASLSRRPMGRIFHPLREMGSHISGTESETPPIKIHGRSLQGIDYVSPVASAQVKSCVLLAGLFAQGRTSVSEPGLSRDHTERMLPMFGVGLPEKCTVIGGSKLQATLVRVPADISSAAFLIAAATLVEDSDVTLQNVGLNPTRNGFLRALKAMGADIEFEQDQPRAGEPTGDIRVRYSGRLKAIDIPETWVPSMVDEIPILMVLAALSDGVSRIRGASELRVKESDRLTVMAKGLGLLGVPVKMYEDGVDITGVNSFRDGVLESAGDHRCAMSFAVMAMRAPVGLLIRDAEYITTSYPGFVDDMSTLGARMQMIDTE